MVYAKNYETASIFVKVIPRKLLASFFLDTVYNSQGPSEQKPVKKIGEKGAWAAQIF